MRGPTNMVPPIRMHDGATRTNVIVADGRVYADLDGDGRIARADEIPGSPQATLAAAAQYVCRYFDIRVPGVMIPGSAIVSHGALNAVEQREFESPHGTAARRRPLLEHLAFFDRANIGRIGLDHNYRSWRMLGFGVLKACILTVGSALLFGGRPGNAFSIALDGIDARRPQGATGIYDAHGRVDDVKLAALCRSLGTTTDVEPVSHQHARVALRAQGLLGTVPRRQFESFFALTARINGAQTIFPRQLRWLYDGSLLWRAASMTDGRGRRAL
jgi:hypothetical protein